MLDCSNRIVENIPETAQACALFINNEDLTKV